MLQFDKERVEISLYRQSGQFSSEEPFLTRFSGDNLFEVERQGERSFRRGSGAFFPASSTVKAADSAPFLTRLEERAGKSQEPDFRPRGRKSRLHRHSEKWHMLTCLCTADERSEILIYFIAFSDFHDDEEAANTLTFIFCLSPAPVKPKTELKCLTFS